MRPLTHIALRSLRGLPRKKPGSTLGWEGGPQAVGGCRGIRLHTPDVPSLLARVNGAGGLLVQYFK